MTKKLSIVIAFIALISLMAGCTGGGLLKATQKGETTAAAKAKLTINTLNGYVTILPGQGENIVVNYEKVATGDNELALNAYLNNDVQISVEETTDTVAISVKRPTTFPADVKSVGANFTINIPQALIDNLVIETSNGPVSVRDFSGKLFALTYNGDVEVEGVTGEIEVHTTNAVVDAVDIAGIFTALNSNGAVYVQSPRGLDDAEVLTSNGSIYFNSVLKFSGDYTLETSNGAIELYVPALTQMTVDASTSNGIVTVTSELEYEESGLNDATNLNGYFNGGGADVYLHTSNGNILIDEWFGH